VFRARTTDIEYKRNVNNTITRLMTAAQLNNQSINNNFTILSVNWSEMARKWCRLRAWNRSVQAMMISRTSHMPEWKRNKQQNQKNKQKP